VFSFLLAIFTLKAYLKVETIPEYTPYLNSSSLKYEQVGDWLWFDLATSTMFSGLNGIVVNLIFDSLNHNIFVN